MVVADTKGTKFWKQFTTDRFERENTNMLLLIPKVLNSESNSQRKAKRSLVSRVVADTKGTKFWKQFTTLILNNKNIQMLLLIPKVLNSESNSQRKAKRSLVSRVVADTKGTKFWKQFTTKQQWQWIAKWLLLIPKVLNSESNSQQSSGMVPSPRSCCWYQRY